MRDPRGHVWSKVVMHCLFAHGVLVGLMLLDLQVLSVFCTDLEV